MAHVAIDLDTTVSADRVIDALTDFSPQRTDYWPNLDGEFYEVESTSETSAEVKEGSAALGGVWELGRYDWSEPGKVRIDVEDSNAFETGSFWLYEVTPRQDGGSHVHMEFDRRPKNFKGRIVSALLNAFGERIFEKQLGETLRRIEDSSR